MEGSSAATASLGKSYVIFNILISYSYVEISGWVGRGRKKVPKNDTHALEFRRVFCGHRLVLVVAHGQSQPTNNTATAGTPFIPKSTMFTSLLSGTIGEILAPSPSVSTEKKRPSSEQEQQEQPCEGLIWKET